MTSSIEIVRDILEMIIAEDESKPVNQTVPEQNVDEYDYLVPEPKVKFGNGKVPRNNHFKVVRHYPKGKTNDIQKESRALHIAMCAGTGIEPDFKFIRKNTAAKLRGSKAYYEKTQVMRAIHDVRRSQLLDMEDDIIDTRVYSIGSVSKPGKIRRCAVSDSPCAPLIPGSSFPLKKDMPRKTFRDALTSW
jgi:hypothetical protein